MSWFEFTVPLERETPNLDTSQKDNHIPSYPLFPLDHRYRAISRKLYAATEMMRTSAIKITKPEMIVAQYLFSKGIRYRKNVRNLPGKPDIVNQKRNFVIQIRGCFWHMHNCKMSNIPKSNRTFWSNKLKSNYDRDKKNDRKIFRSKSNFKKYMNPPARVTRRIP